MSIAWITVLLAMTAPTRAQRLEGRPLVVSGEEGSVRTRTPSPWSGTEFPGIEYFVCPEPVALVQRWGVEQGIEVGVVGDEFTAILDAAPTTAALTMDISMHWRDDEPRLTYLVVFYESKSLASAERRRMRRSYRLPRLIRQLRRAVRSCGVDLDAVAYRASMPRARR